MVFEYVLKVALTSVLVVAVSEVAKRNTPLAAILASLPLTSLLAFVWLHAETGDAQRVADLSRGIFWLVLASLPFFLILPGLIALGWSFWPSMAVAAACTVVAYLGMSYVLARLATTT